MAKNLISKRPPGLVPGTPEWLQQIQGPKLVLRLVKEIEAQEVGSMNPTGARLLGMALDRVYPVLTAVHHTGETNFSRMTDEELKAKLAELVNKETSSKFDIQTAETVDFTEGQDHASD